jgi:hypothetical protein
MRAKTVLERLAEAERRYIQQFGQPPPYGNMTDDAVTDLQLIQRALASGEPYQPHMPDESDE